MFIKRDSLKTDLAKHLYDWSPLPGKSPRVEISEDIIGSFCVRENRKWLRNESWTPESHVVIDGESTLTLHREWSKSWFMFGYEVPILICEDD